jgi:hypothetical protein
MHVRFGIENVDPYTINQAVSSITATHPSLMGTNPGTANVQILRVEIKTKGGLNPFALNGMMFGDKGTLANQISGAKIY